MGSPNVGVPTYPTAAAAVTPSDTTQFEPSIVTVFGAAGDVRVTTAAGQTLTFTSVQPGWDVPCQVVQVWSTGTTATSLFRSY